ncbi:MAG: lytic transglycosylase domain-containing protein [Candidatus Rokubacteria bacterium]|nr:lytic transglycosylase domain-containing protein [Candidatus Rokubacteria bacterium]
MTRGPVALLVLACLAAWQPAAAETYRFIAPDGTVHFTNAPTDPRYSRTGTLSGTASGWLRLSRSQQAYAGEIRAAAARYDVSERLISAVIRVESSFNPRAVSRRGARGLMQLMPATASTLGVQDSFDPGENIDGGVRHLRGLIDRFGTNLPLVLAAYNAGEQAVVAYGGIPPYPETRDYVARVLRLLDGPQGDPEWRSRAVYQRIEPDGTITYTNIPPGGRP